VVLADTGNFSRAAELCHVTQSTLSTGLKEMEARLGVQVAERSTHSVLMTQVGRDLAERARDILARTGDFEARARTEAEAGVTTLRFGAIPTIGPFLLPRALPMIRAAHPQLQVYLREELTEPLVAGLMDGRLDLILVALPHDLPPQVVTHPLFEDGYCLATPRSHPLANLELIEGADLADRDLLLLERGHCLQQHALSSMPGVSLSENSTFSATSLPTLISMVEEGLGITLLPDLARDGGVVRGHEVQLTALNGATPRRIVLAWRSSTSHAALFRSIAELLGRARDALRHDG
jgi:LysR family hydrogen peroxide-inducible transcriptional activator